MIDPMTFSAGDCGHARQVGLPCAGCVHPTCPVAANHTDYVAAVCVDGVVFWTRPVEYHETVARMRAEFPEWDTEFHPPDLVRRIR